MSGEKYLAKHTGRLLILATATLMIASLAYAETPAVPPSGGYVTALTDSGLVRGKLSDDGDVEIYQGIPYAAPPVANLRWAPPQPPAHWSGTRDAFEPGSPCPQTGRLASVNEDCLYLNVWGNRSRFFGGASVRCARNAGVDPTDKVDQRSERYRDLIERVSPRLKPKGSRFAGSWEWCPRPDSNQHALASNRF